MKLNDKIMAGGNAYLLTGWEHNTGDIEGKPFNSLKLYLVGGNSGNMSSETAAGLKVLIVKVDISVRDKTLAQLNDGWKKGECLYVRVWSKPDSDRCFGLEFINE